MIILILFYNIHIYIYIYILYIYIIYIIYTYKSLHHGVTKDLLRQCKFRIVIFKSNKVNYHKHRLKLASIGRTKF